MIFTNDALSSKAPYIRPIIEAGGHFIFGVNSTGNPSLFEWLNGHGYRHLSHVLSLLMFLAFFIDQAQQHCCALFQAAVKKAKSRSRFWRRQQSIFTELYVALMGRSFFMGNR
ncbi:MAG: hypothetical protein ACXVAJ_07970 [Parachlamydiaceae bacterium]